ncbi:unnamed protein product [Phytophthora fragariaefolia]|uniref:Unnamed protein product n=1 Tax=Phytophthora fragariaefolia TaxID=1490495 RepID=A0A9W6Y456_9STRA|nr:unnamed protein product [Phytophthora fragariaefolia]
MKTMIKNAFMDGEHTLPSVIPYVRIWIITEVTREVQGTPSTKRFAAETEDEDARPVRKRKKNSRYQDFVRINGVILNNKTKKHLRALQVLVVKRRRQMGFVCKLIKSLYGTRQAPHVWNKKLHEHLVAIGFVRVESGYGLYARHQEGEISVLFTVYVDDLLLMGPPAECEAVQPLHQETYELVELGPVKYLLGVEVLINQVETTVFKKRILMRYLRGLACNTVMEHLHQKQHRWKRHVRMNQRKYHTEKRLERCIGSDADMEYGEEDEEVSSLRRDDPSVGSRTHEDDSDASSSKRSRSSSDRPRADAGPLPSPRSGGECTPSGVVASRTGPMRDPWMHPSEIQTRIGSTTPPIQYALYSCSGITDDHDTKELDFDPATDQRRDYCIRRFHEIRWYGNKKTSRRSRVPEWQALCL